MKPRNPALLLLLLRASFHETVAWIPSSSSVARTASITIDMQQRRQRLYAITSPFRNDEDMRGWNSNDYYENNSNGGYNNNYYSSQRQQEEKFYQDEQDWQQQQEELMEYDQYRPEQQQQSYNNDNYYYSNEQQPQEPYYPDGGYNGVEYYENNSYSNNGDDEYYNNDQNVDHQSYENGYNDGYSDGQEDQYYDDQEQQQQQQQQQQYYESENQNQNDDYDGSNGAMVPNNNEAPFQAYNDGNNDGNNNGQSPEDNYYYNYQRPPPPRSMETRNRRRERGGRPPSFRPPQLGAMNRQKRRNRSLFDSPLDFFFDDDDDSFFGRGGSSNSIFDLRSPSDSMFSSPFDEIFSSSPFGRRRSGGERIRRGSPFSSMMRDLVGPPRVFSPFSSLDTMDDHFRSMMMMRNGPPNSEAAMFQRRLLEQAERCLNTDIACTTALGEPIQMGPVISQSSRSAAYMMNGRQSRQQESMLQVSVRGSRQGGVVQIVATDSGIQNMMLQVMEERGYPPREINVQLSPNNGRVGSNNSNGPPDVMDAEIVSEDNRRRELAGSY